MTRIFSCVLVLCACGGPPGPATASDPVDDPEPCQSDCPCQGELCAFECVGPECRPDCNSTDLCDVACGGAAQCEVDCNSVDTCRVRCEDAASCEVRCNSVERCEVECPLQGQCAVECNSSNCSCVGPGCP
jgi:hypothetical protein